MKHAVVLLSGGLDSATALAIAIANGYETHALSFDYGQRHVCEVEAAQRVAKALGATEHRVAKIDLRLFGGSALTDNVDVPKSRSEDEIARGIHTHMVIGIGKIRCSHVREDAEDVRAALRASANPAPRSETSSIAALALACGASPRAHRRALATQRGRRRGRGQRCAST